MEIEYDWSITVILTLSIGAYILSGLTFLLCFTFLLKIASAIYMFIYKKPNVWPLIAETPFWAQFDL